MGSRAGAFRAVSMLLLRKRERKLLTSTEVVGAILMMAAGWTKHLLIPLPVTVSLWLLWRSRPAFAKWAISATIALAIAASLAWWFHGVRMFQSLHEPREIFSRHFLVHIDEKILERRTKFSR